MRSEVAPLLGAALALVACGSPPAPSPSPPPALTRLRPLTSHDDQTTRPLAPNSETPPPAGAGASGAAPPGGEAEAARGSIAGTVQLAPALKSRLSPGDVLYIVARNSQTNTVVAVHREGEVRFPLSFELSAADAMMADTSFTGPLDVTARLSKTGDALPAKGDLEGVARGVPVGARGVSLTLDTVRP